MGSDYRRPPDRPHARAPPLDTPCLRKNVGVGSLFTRPPFSATWRISDEDEEGETAGTISGGFPMRPEDIPPHLLEELLGAMTQATEELFGYAEVWESRKGPPAGQTRQL